EKQERQEGYMPTLAREIHVKQVQIPPVLLDMPPYFFAEFVNTSHTAAENVEFLIDLGASKQERLALRPKDRCSSISPEDMSLIRIHCTSLVGGESVFVQAVLTLPLYRRITTSLGGVRGEELTPSGQFDV